MRKISLKDLRHWRYAATLVADFTISPSKALISTTLLDEDGSTIEYCVKTYVGEKIHLEIQTNNLQEAIEKYNSL